MVVVGSLADDRKLWYHKKAHVTCIARALWNEACNVWRAAVGRPEISAKCFPLSLERAACNQFPSDRSKASVAVQGRVAEATGGGLLRWVANMLGCVVPLSLFLLGTEES